MADSGQATFSVNIAGNAPDFSKGAASALEALQKRATAAQDAIKSMSGTLRALRGTSDEVKAAKDKLKSAIDAEKSALSAATLEMVKHGTSLNEVKAKTKATGDVVKAVGGPVAELRAKVTALTDAFGGAGGSSTLLLGSIALLATGMAALTAAFVAGVSAIARFVVVSADAMRSLALTRQGIAGSAADSERMGDQIDRLRQKIPLTTEEFSKLYKGIRTTFDGTRVSGQGILDIVTTLGQTSAAMGDQAAAKVQAILERGKAFGRFQVNSGAFNAFSGGAGGLGELAGTGIKFESIVASFAARTNTTLDQARRTLTFGTKGAKEYAAALAAVRDASEAAFGKINPDKMLSLETQAKKFHDDLAGLTRGIDLTPFLQGLQRIERLFSMTSTSGYGLHAILKAMGLAVNDVAKGGAPILELALRHLILEATRLTIVLLKTEQWIKRTFSRENIAGPAEFRDALVAAKIALGAIGAVAAGVGVTLVAATAPIVLMKQAFDSAYEAASRLYGLIAGQGQLSAGPTRGITDAQRGAGLATGTPPTGLLGSGSPTTVVAPAHGTGGVVMRPAPGEAFASVAPGERIVPAGQGGGGGNVVNVGGLRV